MNATACALVDPAYAPLDPPAAQARVTSYPSSPPAHEFVASIRRAIETLSCGDNYPTVRQTASFVRMSVRTLQRRLAVAGVSHDMLIANARFAMAAAALEQSDAKILDLAFDLGYSDHANFTRAFRRWSGCSPIAFRSRHRAVSIPSSFGKAYGPRVA